MNIGNGLVALWVYCATGLSSLCVLNVTLGHFGGITTTRRQVGPVRTYEVSSTQFSDVGCNGDILYYVNSGVFGTLETYKWDKQGLARLPARRLPLLCRLTNRTPFGTVGALGLSSSVSLIDHEHNTRDVIACAGEHWELSQVSVSGNGRYVAAAYGEEVEFAYARDRRFDRKRVKIGLVDLSSKACEWPVIIKGDNEAETHLVSCVLPSDNGCYIAIAGYDSQVVAIDTHEKKILWKHRPAGEIFTLVAFSADSNVIYVSGHQGRVCAYHVQTGERHASWAVTSDRRMMAGDPVTHLATSPNGEWIAASAGSEVYIASTSTMQEIAKLKPHGSTLLTIGFSPDSESIVTFSDQRLETWSTARWPKAKRKSMESSTKPTSIKPK